MVMLKSLRRFLTVPTMTWLTVMENICLTNDNGIFPFVLISSFMTCYRVCTNGNTTGATDGEGTSYPSGAPEFAVCSGMYTSKLQ